MAINRALVRNLAESSEPLADQTVKEMLRAHRRFECSGGAHGRWQVVEVGGIPLAVFQGSSRRGKQASFRLRRLPPSLEGGVFLPWADLTGSIGEGLDLRLSDFCGSIFVDGYFAGSNFSGAILKWADFSRADLQGCRFRKARLLHADFENADLRGADFRGADLEGASFSGARLQGAVGLPPGILALD